MKVRPNDGSHAHKPMGLGATPNGLQSSTGRYLLIGTDNTAR